MKDENKTKKQLINELAEMRWQLVVMKAGESARKRAESAILESEEKYRSLASTADSMYLLDRDCRYLFMNERYLERLGLPRDKVTGRRYGEFHSEEDTREFEKKVENVFETGRSTQHEYKSERGERYFLRTFSPVKDQEGKATIAVTVVSKDITERTRAEEELKKHKEHLEELVEKRTNELRMTNEQLQQEIAERKKLISELQESITKIRVLRGLLPICTSCKKIRNDKGYWQQLEIYIRDHSEADFSHSICPNCFKKLYPEYYKDK